MYTGLRLIGECHCVSNRDHDEVQFITSTVWGEQQPPGLENEAKE